MHSSANRSQHTLQPTQHVMVSRVCWSSCLVVSIATKLCTYHAVGLMLCSAASCCVLCHAGCTPSADVPTSRCWTGRRSSKRYGPNTHWSTQWCHNSSWLLLVTHSTPQYPTTSAASVSCCAGRRAVLSAVSRSCSYEERGFQQNSTPAASWAGVSVRADLS